ncbi:MAG TPA: 50S ribosomal protein L9 [Anaerolineales bacterium]|nr:50S ribosomal protein L9 [Anaerolineales bacterium]HRQ91633.1 50S ribosomal protein L9 [Anaerolineales bacterium]
MQVLLLQDVYKLGRAGQIKKVANGYGRNYLIPQGLAIPATANAIKMAEKISANADKARSTLNAEAQAIAEKLKGVQLLFPARAGETGKLYGSITTQAIAEQLSEKLGSTLDRRQIHVQPLRLLGMHKVAVRLTLDVIPEVDAVVYREGESPENYMVDASELAAASDPSQGKPAEVVEAVEAEAEPVAEEAEAVEAEGEDAADEAAE